MSRSRMALVVAAAAIVVTVVALAAFPRSGTSDPSARRRATPLPTRYGSTTDLSERLASGGATRGNLDEARDRLTFTPVLPGDTLGRNLRGVYTRAASDVRPSDRVRLSPVPGRDNVFQALYEDDIQIMEKQWDPSVVPDAATYGQNLTINFVSPEKFVRTTKVDGVTYWMWDRISVPEVYAADGSLASPGMEVTTAQVSWFDDGISYFVASPYVSAADLFKIARTMAR